MYGRLSFAPVGSELPLDTLVKALLIKPEFENSFPKWGIFLLLLPMTTSLKYLKTAILPWPSVVSLFAHTDRPDRFGLPLNKWSML